MPRLCLQALILAVYFAVVFSNEPEDEFSDGNDLEEVSLQLLQTSIALGSVTRDLSPPEKSIAAPNAYYVSHAHSEYTTLLQTEARELAARMEAAVRREDERLILVLAGMGLDDQVSEDSRLFVSLALTAGGAICIGLFMFLSKQQYSCLLLLAGTMCFLAVGAVRTGVHGIIMEIVWFVVVFVACTTQLRMPRWYLDLWFPLQIFLAPFLLMLLMAVELVAVAWSVFAAGLAGWFSTSPTWVLTLALIPVTASAALSMRFANAWLDSDQKGS